MSTNALFAVRRVLQHPSYCTRLASIRPPLRALHGSSLRLAVEGKERPSQYATASRHPFAEEHGGGSSKPEKESSAEAKEKDRELAGDPNDPGSRPKIGPFSKPVDDDTAPSTASAPSPAAADQKSEEWRETHPEPAAPEEDGDHHEHPELRTRTGPHSSPVEEAPKPEKIDAVVPIEVKGPATGPSSTPTMQLEMPQALAIPPLPPPSYFGPAHQFDTYRFVQKLEGSKVGSASARALMEGVRTILAARSRRAQESMLSQQELDNQAYRFKAALSALRTEISIKARNDGLSMRAASTAMQREVEGLDRKMTEDLQGLRHDIEMELNTRKDDTRALMKRFDIATEEINNKFTISLGELRTEIESAKWEATRRAIAIIITLVICGVAISTFTSTLTPPPVPPVPPVPPSTTSTSTGTGTDAGTAPGGEGVAGGSGAGTGGAGGMGGSKPTYRDIGVGPDDEKRFDAEDDLDLLHDDIDALLEQSASAARKLRADQAAAAASAAAAVAAKRAERVEREHRAEEKKMVDFPERI